MTVIITFTSIGTDAGPFNLYSNVDGYTSAFAVGVTRTQLLAGYPSAVVPIGTTVIRAKSFSACTNFVNLNVVPAPATTTTTTIVPTTTTTSSSSTSTSTSSTSTTTSTSSTTTTTTTACPNRFLLGVNVESTEAGVVTLQYIRSDTMTGVTQTWNASGVGEFHTFSVNLCVVESSVGIDTGSIITIDWNDGTNCCP